MAVAVTEERVKAVYDWLVWLARHGRPCPTNKQIGLGPMRLGSQRFQPADRMIGIKLTKCEHGAVVIAELERRGMIKVQRGRNWRVITIVESGLVLRRQRPCTDGSTHRRMFRGAA